MSPKLPASLLALVPVFVALHYLVRAQQSRKRRVLPTDERVLILGASSGIGRSIAHVYAKRGARICVVARRSDNVQEVVQECRAEKRGDDGVVGCVADFTEVKDMIRVRNLIAEGV
jgi:NAD(P)-dependent dehydrogenase (short-subunit alcohol dehydrogenase family)